MLTVNPYLGFDGDCEEAFELYRSIFGGELEISRFSEMPADTPVDPVSAEDSRRIFEALAAGGQVTMPYGRQFWGADYGMCTDRFGIHWMVNYDPSAS